MNNISVADTLGMPRSKVYLGVVLLRTVTVAMILDSDLINFLKEVSSFGNAD